MVCKARGPKAKHTARTKRPRDPKAVKKRAAGRAYPSKTKASDRYKAKCNACIGRLASHCTSAVVLDTSFFKTTRSILKTNPAIESVTCPQMDTAEFKRMRRARSRLPNRDNVVTLHGTMRDVIDTHLPCILKAGSRVMVWHDAMSTWSAESRTSTSIKADIARILQIFARSSATNMILAVTVCTRSHQAGENVFMGGNRTMVCADIMDMAQTTSTDLRIRLLDELAYPQMFFSVWEVHQCKVVHVTSTNASGGTQEDGHGCDNPDPGPWKDRADWMSLESWTSVTAGCRIAHKFFTAEGWDVGVVKKKSNGYWIVRYASDGSYWKHALEEGDYGRHGCWVHVH